MATPSVAPIADPDPSLSHGSDIISMRKAWRVLVASFLVFVVLVNGAGAGLLTYRAHATRPRTGTVSQIITGVQASVQRHQQIGYKVLAEGDVLDEGDTVKTPQDTRVRLVLFDGTTVELSGGTTMTIERLRSSQYLTQRATIVLQQEMGRVIVGTGTDTGFARANVTVKTHSGAVEARQPDSTFRVLVLPEQDKTPETTSVSVLGGPAVLVSGAGQQVTVNNGQQTTVPVGLTPTAPTIKQRELVTNGTFSFDAKEIGKPATRWREIPQAEAKTDGFTSGGAELIGDTVIRGQKMTALHLVRNGGNVDNDQVGIEQIFPFGELDEFDQVTLTADVKVVSHSLSAGGDIGSEYPLIILLRYEDSRGLAQPDKGWGFFTQNDAGNRTNNGTLIGQQIMANTWTPFTLDLKTVKPAPYKLVGLQLYASGHDFDSYIANVSIIAK